jgi:hypothetical protein
MTSPININNQYTVTASPTKPYSRDALENSVFENVYGGQLTKIEVVEKPQFSNRISQINQENVAVLYNELKLGAKEKLDGMNLGKEELKPSDYHNATIEEIMKFPIEVKIERDEINQAIIYNRLGINYLDVKKLEVKMELLALAKGEVLQQKKQGAITEVQAQLLVDKIEHYQMQLTEEKQNLLEGRQPQKNEQLFFDQLTKQKDFSL